MLAVCRGWPAVAEFLGCCWATIIPSVLVSVAGSPRGSGEVDRLRLPRRNQARGGDRHSAQVGENSRGRVRYRGKCPRGAQEEIDPLAACSAQAVLLKARSAFSSNDRATALTAIRVLFSVQYDVRDLSHSPTVAVDFTRFIRPFRSDIAI